MAKKFEVLKTGVLALCASAVIATGFPLDASADPDAVKEAKKKVEKLEMEAAALDQEAIGAQEKLDQAQARLNTQREDVDKQTEKVEDMKRQVGKMAVAQYQDRNVDPTTQLFLQSEDADFLSRYATVQQLNSNHNDVLQAYQTEQSNLNDMRRSAATDVATIDEQKQKISEARDESARKLDEAKQELDRLTEEERKRLEEEQRREAEAARQAAEGANDSADPASDGNGGDGNGGNDDAGGDGDGNEDGSNPGSGSDPAPAPPGSSKGVQALAWAKGQIGKPYIYGGTGPSGYDCSGLTGSAWASVGVSLPRTSQAQYGAGSSVSKGDLQPGDLVFYYGGISHVALYAGNGQILHASRPGKPIGYAPLDSMPYAGARRVG